MKDAAYPTDGMLHLVLSYSVYFTHTLWTAILPPRFSFSQHFSSLARKEIRRGVSMPSNCTTWAPLSLSTSRTVPAPNMACFTRWPMGKTIALSSSGRYRWLCSTYSLVSRISPSWGFWVKLRSC